MWREKAVRSCAFHSFFLFAATVCHVSPAKTNTYSPEYFRPRVQHLMRNRNVSRVWSSPHGASAVLLALALS